MKLHSYGGESLEQDASSRQRRDSRRLVRTLERLSQGNFADRVLRRSHHHLPPAKSALQDPGVLSVSFKTNAAVKCVSGSVTTKHLSVT